MKQSLTAGRKFHKHLATIRTPVPAPQSTLVHKTIYKFHRTVMAKAELLRERSNSGMSTPRQALDRQEKLMLLGFDALGMSRFLTKVMELTDTVSELSKPPKACF